MSIVTIKNGDLESRHIFTLERLCFLAFEKTLTVEELVDQLADSDAAYREWVFELILFAERSGLVEIGYRGPTAPLRAMKNLPVTCTYPLVRAWDPHARIKPSVVDALVWRPEQGATAHELRYLVDWQRLLRPLSATHPTREADQLIDEALQDLMCDGVVRTTGRRFEGGLSSLVYRLNAEEVLAK